MAAELFALVPANQGEVLRARAQELARPGENTRELAFHQLLISYLDNRYLAKAYQQFLDGYISYVILYLKENGQESALILSELANAIGNGEGGKNCPDNAALFPYACGNYASTYEGLGKCRSLN